ncbi:MAG TPA: Rrf2 family transcriptional regulator [Pirellulaceae bacterium]|nr:Rrf2 family transcriptional regulator [Pirellulaceae bacterium]
MNISAKTEYACIAVLELAQNYGTGEPVRIKRIADIHGIPSRFLVQILLQLKGAGLVNSTRGASGGYQLVQEPKSITLMDVMSVIEGPPSEMTGSTNMNTPHARVLWKTWRQASEVQRATLAKITFADLVERIKSQPESMYYI